MSTAGKGDQGGKAPGCELLFAGGASWSMVGRSQKPASWDGVEDLQVNTFSRIKPLMGVPIRKVITGCNSNHILAITMDSKALVWGRNEDAQLGLGDFTNRYHPTHVQDVANAVDGCCGMGHTMILTRDHAVYAAGRNDNGQCGVGRTSKHVTGYKPVVGGIVAVNCSAGRNFSIIIDSNGRVFAMGCPDHGQLGNNTDGRMLERAGKITFRNESSPIPVSSPDIIGIKMAKAACGANHTCTMDEEGRLFTWGFGGYGQLGHGDNKNQMEPKAIAFFNNDVPEKPPGVPSFLWRPPPKVRAISIASGTSCTYAIANRQVLYMWGITKKSGESTMAPAVFEGLSGWKCRGVATGNSATIVISGTSTITWGPGPTWGELAYGEGGPKSSARTKKAECMEGVAAAQVAMGSNMSLVLVPQLEENKEFLESVPVLDQEELVPGAGGGSGAGSSKGTKTKSKSRKKKAATADEDTKPPKKKTSKKKK